MLCKVKRDFSNTIFGNVAEGRILDIDEKRYQFWKEQGLVQACDKKGNLIEDEEEVVVEDNEEEVVDLDLGQMTKNQIEAYAKEAFGVDLDKRRSKEDLVADVVALMEVNGNG